jgi:hypothetical protein
MGHHFRMGAPEGTRADGPARRTTRPRTVVAIALVAALFSLGVGGGTVNLTVANLTPHAIRVVVADRIFPGVAPGEKATFESRGAVTVSAKVSYLPGQGVEGSAERSFALAPYNVVIASNPDYGLFFGCRAGGGAITSPASGGPVFWSVTADTLATR